MVSDGYVPTDLEGRILDGRYELGSLIRSTAKSWVFDACEVGEVITPGGSDLAVKVLRPDLGVDRQDQFKREVRTHRELDGHDGIATLYAAGFDDPYFYAAMQRVPGDDLHTQISGGRIFSFSEVLDVMGTVCDASQFIHDRVGGHHDIKSKNIRFSGSRGYLLDFGGRLRVSDPGYNDVYALGVVLEELLSAREKRFSRVGLDGLNTVVSRAKSFGYENPAEVGSAVSRVGSAVSRRKFLFGGLTVLGLAGLGAVGYEVKRSFDRDRELKASMGYTVNQIREVDVSSKDFSDLLVELGRRLSFQRVLPVDDSFDKGNFPYAIPPGDSKWFSVGQDQWTSGFWPGILWDSFRLTGDGRFRDRALSRIRGMDIVSSDKNSIAPVRFFYSHVGGLDVCDDPLLDRRALDAAELLLGRFNSEGGYIQLSGPLSVGDHTSFLGSFQAVHLLGWAHKRTGDDSFLRVVRDHCRFVDDVHVRDDGSVLQVVGFNARNPSRRVGRRAYGHSGTSCHARSQLFAIDGFLKGFEVTGDSSFLDSARKCADYYLSNLPDSLVPFYDFMDPKVLSGDSRGIPLDTSASAVLQTRELGNLLGDGSFSRKSLEMVKSLVTNHFSVDPSYQGNILNGCLRFPQRQYVDTSVIHGDYQFVRALASLA